jgi:hypothetical protein
LKLSACLALCLAALSPALALAQPAPAPAPAPAGDKVDAKALMASGLKLYAAKDYLGALAVFKEAYDRFPSSKILLNIGTTLKALGRDAEAANTYQRFLDAADADVSKKGAVDKELAELDGRLATVEIKASLADAELQIGDEQPHPASELTKYRVAPGKVTVHVHKTHFQPYEKTLDLVAGQTTSLSVDLVAAPEVTPVTQVGSATPAGNGIHAALPPAASPSKLGAIAVAHIDFKYKGGAGVVGATMQVATGLQAEVAGIFGPSWGAYVGARYALLTGSLHPTLAAGVPLFVSSGARIGVRGAGGVQLDLTPHLALVGELGVEHVFNPQANIAGTLFIPAIGALGRL